MLSLLHKREAEAQGGNGRISAQEAWRQSLGASPVTHHPQKSGSRVLALASLWGMSSREELRERPSGTKAEACCYFACGDSGCPLTFLPPFCLQTCAFCVSCLPHPTLRHLPGVRASLCGSPLPGHPATGNSLAPTTSLGPLCCTNTREGIPVNEVEQEKEVEHLLCSSCLSLPATSDLQGTASAGRSPRRAPLIKDSLPFLFSCP